MQLKRNLYYARRDHVQWARVKVDGFDLRIPPLFGFQAKITQNWSNTLIRYIINIFDQIWYPWRHPQKFSKFLFCPLVTTENVFMCPDWYQNDQWVLSFKMMYNNTTFYIQWKKWSFWPLNRLLTLSVVSVKNVL